MATATATPAAPAARRLRETPEKSHPGWTRLQWEDASDGHMLNTQFRGPGGEVISRHQFRQRLATGEIATLRGKDAQPAAKPPKPPVSSGSARPLSAPEPDPEPLAPALELPEAKASSRAAPGVASAAELSLTAQIGLAIVSSLLAWLTSTPELQMSQQEAQSVAVPLANIFQKSELNARYGRYLAGSSDYTLLGYALYGYGFRVAQQMRQRADYEAAQAAVGGPHVPYAPYAPGVATQFSQPAGPAQPTPGATGADSTAATGGILGAATGAVSAQASNIVGHNPVPAARPR